MAVGSAREQIRQCGVGHVPPVRKVARGVHVLAALLLHLHRDQQPVVEQVYEADREAGALGGKLLGAGGTGFLLLYVPEAQQEGLVRRLSPRVVLRGLKLELGTETGVQTCSM